MRKTLPVIQQLPTCLLYGRGPSIVTSEVKDSKYDVVIRTKRCNCEKWPHARCDVLVLYEGELTAKSLREYDVARCKVDTVWLFDPFGERGRGKGKEGRAQHKQLSNKHVHVFGNSTGKHGHFAQQLGFRTTSFPRFSTGIATILEALENCAHPITLLGFDNIVYNLTLGEADHPDRIGCVGRNCERQHDFSKESNVIKLLKALGTVHAYPLSHIHEEYVEKAKRSLDLQQRHARS